MDELKTRPWHQHKMAIVSACHTKTLVGYFQNRGIHKEGRQTTRQPLCRNMQWHVGLHFSLSVIQAEWFTRSEPKMAAASWCHGWVKNSSKTPTQNGDCVDLPYKNLSRLFSKQRNRQRRRADNNSSAIVEERAVTCWLTFFTFCYSNRVIHPKWTQDGRGQLVSWMSWKLIHDTSCQQLGWIPPDAVNTVKCSWWWAKTSPETCRAD